VSDDVIYQERDGSAWITINHPERHNSFDEITIKRLGEAVQEAGNKKPLGAIVITGAGDRAFCAGGYLGTFAEVDHTAVRKMIRAALNTLNGIRHAPKPVIAAVNGFAIGGGNELVVACDLAIASDRAKFGQVGPKVGSAPVYGATNLLSMIIGEKRAKEVCFLCHQYSAEEAFNMGWINKVVPHDQLYSEVESWCQELLDMSPTYLEITKASSNVWWDALTPAFFHAEQALLAAAGGPEMLEGARSFFEKRKADFRQFRK
jgi:2-ketocyclohexanecarboxyl-CoA hydrolase